MDDMKFDTPMDSARFLDLQALESGDWLYTISSPNIGTFL